MSLPEERRAELKAGLFERVGSPEGPFSLPARAWYGLGRA
jgi:hypothetical protein